MEFHSVLNGHSESHIQLIKIFFKADPTVQMHNIILYKVIVFNYNTL